MLRSIGTVTFDTDTLALSYEATRVGTGTLYSQAAGLPDIAVFTFDTLALPANPGIGTTGVGQGSGLSS